MKPRLIILFLAASLILRVEAATNQVLSCVPDAYLAVPDSPSLDLTGSFTVAFWFQPRVLNTEQRLLGKGVVPRATVADWSFTFGGQNLVWFFWESANDANHLVGTTQVVSDLDFHHVAGVIDVSNGVFHIYFDGGAPVTQPTNGETPAPNNYALYMGRRLLTTGWDRSFDGNLDEVSIWNRALTSNEIRSLMFSTLTGGESNLVAYWNFDNGTEDGTANHNHGVLNLNATILATNWFRPRIVGLGLTNGNPWLAFHTWRDTTYAIEASSSLQADSWQAVGPAATGNGDVVIVSDLSNVATTGFYRIVSPQ